MPKGKRGAPCVRELEHCCYGTKNALMGFAKLPGILRNGDFPGDKGTLSSASIVERDGWKIYLRPSTPPEFRLEILAKPSFADILQAVVDRASRDYVRSHKARKRLGWDEGKKISHGPMYGVERRSHGACVDFVGSAEELVKAGLALSEWFVGNGLFRRVLFDGREIELYRTSPDEKWELSIPYQKGDARQRCVAGASEAES